VAFDPKQILPLDLQQLNRTPTSSAKVSFFLKSLSFSHYSATVGFF
jgi:hypothetical protein